jgi:hypothetical protein
VPENVINLYRRFYTDLIQQQPGARFDFNPMNSQAVEEIYAASLHIAGACRPLFQSWRDFVLGPGVIDGRGARQPTGLCRAVAIAQRVYQKYLDCADAVRMVQEELLGASPRGPGLAAIREQLRDVPLFTFAVSPGQEPGTYFGLARFIHLPQNLLWVGTTVRNGDPTITSVLWVPAN